MPYSDRRSLHGASPISRIEVTHCALTSKLGKAIMMTKKLGKWGIRWKKEDIAAISRRENKNRDLAEIETVSRAGSIAARVGAGVCCG